MKTLGIAVLVCAALAAPATPANAQTERFTIDVTVTGQPRAAGSTAEHFLTFSGPVQVPGVSLAPGAYIFRFLTPSVVQVLSGDRATAYAMLPVIPAWRPDAPAGHAVTFAANRFDAPVRLARLFTPGSTSGVEFLYAALRPMQDFVIPFGEDVTLLR